MGTLTTHPALEAQKFSVKFFVDAGQDLGLEAFVPVFHGWIQQQGVERHLLVDVASYAHVKGGPGVVLVAHEANIGIDEQGGRRGLLYVRKAATEGEFAERLGRVIADTWALARKLEAEPAFAGKLRFAQGEFSIRIHDRLRAPNTAETWEAIKPAVEQAAQAAVRGAVQLQWIDDAEKLLEVRVKRA